MLIFNKIDDKFYITYYFKEFILLTNHFLQISQIKKFNEIN